MSVAVASGALESCAEFLGRVRSGAAVPRAVTRTALESFVDTFAVMYSGSREPAAHIAAAHAVEMSSGDGLARLVTGERAAPAWAAFANATAAHSQDFDDYCPAVLGGHASAILVPVALAVAESIDASGHEALRAYSVGFEVMIALARGVNPWHYEAGFHPTSTLGTFGAAATAAYLLGLTDEETTHALAAAASLASGLKVNFGTMVKPLHCGWAAFAGINAAMLARLGLRGNALAYEGDQGFGAAFGGWSQGAPRGPRVRLGPDWFLETSGMPVRKPWPCCGSVQASVEGALRLRERHGLSAKDIEAVRVGVHRRRLPHTDRPDPSSATQARFSNQYCVATALARGAVTQGSFEPEAIADEDVRNIMARVALGEDDRFEDADSSTSTASEFGSRVEVRTRSGSIVAIDIERPLGGAGRPLPAAELERKFADCTASVLPDDVSHALLERLWVMEGAARAASVWP